LTVELSYREKKILRGLFEGYSNIGIAAREGLSPRSIEHSVTELAKKLAPESRFERGLNMRSSIVFAGVRLGLVGREEDKQVAADG